MYRWPVIGALLLSGCVQYLGQEGTEQGSLLRDCVVAAPENATLSAPISVPLPGHTLWVYPLVAFSDGRFLRATASRVESGADPCVEPPPLLVTDAGAPRELLRLSDAEQARPDGAQLQLYALAGVAVRDVAYLFYEQTLAGQIGEQVLGVGLCQVDAEQTECARLSDASGSTLLFPAGGLRPTAALAHEGFVYVLSCVSPAAFEQTCVLARVGEGELADPAAYRYASLDGWASERGRAVGVLHEVGAPSLRFDPEDSGPTSVVINPFDATVSARTADAWGNAFGDRRPLFDLASPRAGELLAGGHLELGLAQGAKQLFISYSTSNERAPGLHLAQFELKEPFR